MNQDKYLENRVRDLSRGEKNPSASKIAISLNASPSAVAKILQQLGRK